MYVVEKDSGVCSYEMTLVSDLSFHPEFRRGSSLLTCISPFDTNESSISVFSLANER